MAKTEFLKSINQHTKFDEAFFKQIYAFAVCDDTLLLDVAYQLIHINRKDVIQQYNKWHAGWITDPGLKTVDDEQVKNGYQTVMPYIGIPRSKKANGPMVYIPSRVEKPKRDFNKAIKSGITVMDKLIIGFFPGELSLWSGTNGSGKSTILSQFAIEAANQGKKVLIYSGELPPDRLMDWVHLQAAGRNNVIATAYENYFTVPDEIAEKINKWLDGKFYIYNNSFGNGINYILSAVEHFVRYQHIEMVIIDNLMSLDLSSVSGERYEKQTNLVLGLSALAKGYKIHIHFVAHPRKSLGFLRKEDISGTADLTNAADNVFIVHRVNNDFKNRSKVEFGWKDTNEIYNYSNVIEICKNRSLGMSDRMTGTYFEIQSKRFLNTENENKRYGWETDTHQDYQEECFSSISDDELPFHLKEE